MKIFKEKLQQFLGAIILMVVFGGCFYLIYTHREITPPPKNTNYCAAIKYFDKSKSSFTYQYNQSIFYDDSLVNFTTPDGKVWWAKDFADKDHRTNEDGVEYDDVTLKDGTRYMVYQISEGGCKIKAVEDSIYNKLTEDNQPDDDNN